MGRTAQELLLLLIFGLTLVLAGLTLLIVLNKAWREMLEALERRRRAVLEPAVFGYAGSRDRRVIADHLPKPLSPRDLRVVEAVLLDAARIVKGDSRDRVTVAFERLGLVHAAIASLGSQRWWKRADAAEKLGTMRSRLAVEHLVAAMNDQVSEVRIRAARALGIIRGSTSIKPLVQALADPSRWSAIRVAEILIGVGDEAVDELLASYDTLPLHAKIAAIEVIGRIRSPRGADRLRAALRDTHPDVRARAAHAMGRIGDPAFAGDLTQALEDSEWAVRAMAAKAIGRVGAKDAIPELSRLVSDRQWWVRSNAGDALRALGQGGQRALIEMLDAEDTFARHQAVSQLQEGGIIDQYVSDLASPDEKKRQAAASFVEKIISLQRVDQLTQHAIEHTQDSVRKVLMDILHRADEEKA